MSGLAGGRSFEDINAVTGRVPAPGAPSRIEEVKPNPGTANLPPGNVKVIEPKKIQEEVEADRFAWHSELQKMEARIRQLEMTVSILEENNTLILEDLEELQNAQEEDGEDVSETEESQKAPSSIFNQAAPEPESSSSA
jgi:TolA-binding protein